MADREIPWGSGLLNPPSGGQNYGGRLDPTLVDEEEMNPDSYNVMANLNLPTSSSVDQVGVSSGGAGGDWEDTKRLAGNALTMEVFVDGLKEGRISEAELEQAIESGAELIRGRPRIIAVAALAKFRRDKAQAANSLNESRFQGTSQPTGQTWERAFQGDKDIAQKTYEAPPLMEGSTLAMDEGRFDPEGFFEMYDRAPYGEATPDMRPREPGRPYQTYPRGMSPFHYALGGPVTPAGPGTFPQTASETMMAMGGSPSPGPSSDAGTLIQELEAVRRDGTMDQVRSFLSNNMANLLTVASQDPNFANRLQSIIASMPRGGGGELLAPPGPMGRPVGEYQIYDDPASPTSPVGTNEADAWAGMGSSFPGPSFRPWKGTGTSGLREYEVLDQTAPDYEALEEVRGNLGRIEGNQMSEFAHGGYVRGRGREDEDDVRPVRRTLDNALSPTLSRRMFS